MTSLLPVPFERCEWPPVPAQSGCASSGPRTSLCGCHGAAPGQTGPEAGLNCTHLTQCRFLAWAPGSVGAALAEPRPPPHTPLPALGKAADGPRICPLLWDTPDLSVSLRLRKAWDCW